jgi:hypothetical protein
MKILFPSTLLLILLTFFLVACGPAKTKTLTARPEAPAKVDTPPAPGPTTPVVAAPDAACTGPCTIATGHGATFPVPERFKGERRKNVVTLIEPDNVVQVAVVRQVVGERRSVEEDVFLRAGAPLDGTAERVLRLPAQKNPFLQLGKLDILLNASHVRFIPGGCDLRQAFLPLVTSCRSR